MKTARVNVAVTGVGVVSACGNNLVQTLACFDEGRRNASKITLFPSEFICPVFEAGDFTGANNKDRMRTLNLALAAAGQALDDAGLKNNLDDLRLGVCLGTTVACQLNDVDFYAALRRGELVSMDSVDRYLKGNLAEAVARYFNLKGVCCTITNACSSGTDAIGTALSWLRNDYCDIALAGGADELNRIPLAGFSSLGVVSNDLCAPFDRDRRGLNLGEGAGILVMEKESLARKRGLKPNLFLGGYGLSADAYHLIAPHPEGLGLEQALVRALDEAGIKPKEVGFVNAHGTATLDNDKVEGKALVKFFGPEIKVLSTKGFTGHTLGAAGGLEAVFTVTGLKEGWLPQSIGFVNKDDEIPLTPLTRRTQINSGYAVSTSLAFGGNNSALVFCRRDT
ncbi:MAG: beta-ketoacyl-[acyl-carrier-protein] synthase family protein [Candidatus Ratteibacteria bacterium]